MNINFDDYAIPIIVIGCLCIGYVLKNWMPADNKIIPTVLLVLGGISGAILFGLDFTGIVEGMFSGLVAVGLHQLFYQYIKNKSPNEMTEEEALLAMEESEYLKEELKALESEGEDG